MPEGEKVRNAVKWISNECKESENKKIESLICKASTLYNLSPKDEEFLRVFYCKKKDLE